MRGWGGREGREGGERVNQKYEIKRQVENGVKEIITNGSSARYHYPTLVSSPPPPHLAATATAKAVLPTSLLHSKFSSNLASLKPYTDTAKTRSALKFRFRGLSSSISNVWCPSGGSCPGCDEEEEVEICPGWVSMSLLMRSSFSRRRVASMLRDIMIECWISNVGPCLCSGRSVRGI